MINEKTASELISKSLRQALTEDEAAQVNEHLGDHDHSRNFAKLSRVIQDSVVSIAQSSLAGGTGFAPAMPDDMRERLKSSVSKAAEQKLNHSSEFGAGIERTIALAGVEPEAGDERKLVSNFTLIRKLGEGGLGRVWMARDEKLNRNVAIKEMNFSGVESQKAWQRFRREAEITGHLEHPNVVPLYLYGMDQLTGEPFYAMRFVGKRSLADAIIEYHELKQEGRVEVELGMHRLLSAFLDVCQAIAYAHSRGVVHRDLKPENVALDSFGQVIVLDWGLAKLLDEGELALKLDQISELNESALAQTLVGEVIGTPLYMAPEQAAGDLDSIDERTDVYGLGAILFAILTGCAPHENNSASTAAKVRIQDVLNEIAQGKTPRPKDFAPDISCDLEAICIKAMSPRPFARHERVTELANEVERWMAGQSGKQSRYKNLRMEGRELRADLQSTVRDLEINARFMSRLPPIQEMISHPSEEEFANWRKRLASIFNGLLGTNSDYQNIVFCRVDGSQFTELVRVERHSTDLANIRSIPKSRLRTADVSKFIENVIELKPEEVVTSLICDPFCDKSTGCDSVRLVAAVPVYDSETEEPFGCVMIDCDIDRVMRRQMSRRSSASEIVIACDVHQVMMRSESGRISEDSLGKPINEEVPHFVEAISALQNQLEFIDERNVEVYGARLWLRPNQHGLMYLLR